MHLRDAPAFIYLLIFWPQTVIRNELLANAKHASISDVPVSPQTPAVPPPGVVVRKM